MNRGNHAFDVATFPGCGRRGTDHLRVGGDRQLLGRVDGLRPRVQPPAGGHPPTGLSAVGNAVTYDLLPFYVTAADTYTLQTLDAQFASPSLADDTFLVLYRNAFNPLSPLTNALSADDDTGAGFLSSITFGLTTGVQYFLVTTSFVNGAFGSYAGSISNGGAGTAILGTVPEPSTTAMMLVALAAGAGVVARRRNVG